MGGNKSRELIERSSRTHEITVGLSAHGTEKDIRYLENILKTARELGQPYHAICTENYLLTEKEWRERLKINEENKESLSRSMEGILAKGIGRKEAERRLFESCVKGATGHTAHPEVEASLLMLAWKHNLPYIDIEYYSPEEKKMLKTLNNTYTSLHEQATSANKSFSEKEKILERAKKVEGFYLQLRNRRIAEVAPNVAGFLKHTYPELRKHDSLRLLYQVGNGHAGAVLEKQEGISFSPAFSPEETPNLVQDLELRLSLNPEAKLTDAERRRIVLDSELGSVLLGLYKEGKTDAISTLRSSVTKITAEEYKELEKAAGDKPVKVRGQIIAEYLFKKMGKLQ